jgi:hypothetical protein
MPSLRTAKILRRVIKEAKKLHYNRLTAKSNNKIKTTWNIIKEDTGKVYPVELVPTLLANDKKFKDPRNVTHALSIFFITITEK